MGSRQLLTLVAVSLVLSMLLVPMFGQAFANDPGKKIEYNPKFPPLGSVYAVKLYGIANIPMQGISTPVSAYLELKVTNIKSWGVPTISLALINGNLALGDETYSLTRGTTLIVPVNSINMKESSEDGLKILTALAALTRPLPISTSDATVDLVPAVYNDPANIQIKTQNWFIDYFTGNISMIK